MTDKPKGPVGIAKPDKSVKPKIGRIRVGKLTSAIDIKNPNATIPTYPGHISVIVKTKSDDIVNCKVPLLVNGSKVISRSSLSPYYTKVRIPDVQLTPSSSTNSSSNKNPEMGIMENIWQASKLYPFVSDQHQVAKWNSKLVLWDYKFEVHYGTGIPGVLKSSLDTKNTNTNTVVGSNKLNTSQYLIHSNQNLFDPELICTDRYKEWRLKLMRAPYAIRYPNGYYGRHDCIGSCIPSRFDPKLYTATEFKLVYPNSQTSITKSKNRKDRKDRKDVKNVKDLKDLSDNNDVGADDTNNTIIETTKTEKYIEARKRLYCPLYGDSVKGLADFKELQKLLVSGQSLLILDVDGPTKTNDFPFSLVETFTSSGPSGLSGPSSSGPGSIEINEQTTKALLNDPSQAFGHGYVLAVYLLSQQDWLL